MTGFSKTDQNVILVGLFQAQLIAALTHYTFIVALVGLADWFAFL